MGVERGQLREVERLARLSPWIIDVDSDMLWCSPELFVLHGMEIEGGRENIDLEQLPLSTWLTLLPQADRAALEALRARVIATGHGGEIEYEVRHGQGTRWLSTFAAVAERVDGRITRVCGYTLDISARKRIDERHRVVRDTLATYRGAMELIARGEPVSSILDSGAGWLERRLPGTRGAILLVDRVEGLMQQVASTSAASGFAALVDGLRVGEGFGPWGAAAARRAPVMVEDVRTDPLTAGFAQALAALDVASMWVRPIIRAGSDELIGVLALYHAERQSPSKRELELGANVSDVLALALERESVDAELRRNANIDPLTGTLNRLRFIELINDRITSADTPLAVLCLEIDRFKQLRVSLDAYTGDQLIAEVGRRLIAAVGDRGLVGHFNGDEYGVMVDAGPDVVDAVAKAIHESFRLPIVLEDEEFFLTVSLGIAYEDGETDGYGLVRAAAAAMHEARADGFGRQRVYDRTIATQLIDRMGQETELRRAIESGELLMHYQPILRLSDRAWDRAESLVRWQHPTRGLVPPGEFIPLAEQAGLMNALGDAVIELVIAQASVWSQTLQDVQLSVNISAIQLRRPKFAERLLAMLDRASLPAATLLLEVTESAILEDIDAARNTLGRLRQAGIRAAIDDFGTGYSSLARLGELPITGVKIDRSFVAGLGSDERARAIFEAIADIVRAHGLLIIAEGIEDERTLEEIEALGCHFAQGYHLCRPGPPELVGPFLAAPVPERLTRLST